MFQKLVFSLFLATFLISSGHSIPILPNIPSKGLEGFNTEKIAEPVPKIVHLSNEKGPIAEYILQNHPRLSFIGTMNEKNFYIEREEVDWNSAVTLCQNLNMSIAKFDSPEELNLIYANLPSEDGFVWTGAKVNLAENWPRFFWQDENFSLMSPPIQWFFTFNAEIVLAFSVDAAQYPGLYGMRLKSELHYPICYM